MCVKSIWSIVSFNSEGSLLIFFFCITYLLVRVGIKITHYYGVGGLSVPLCKVVIFFSFFGTGAWTQGLTLAMQALYHLSHSASPFLWWVFFLRQVFMNCLPGWLRTMIFLISASWVAWLQAWATSARLIVMVLWNFSAYMIIIVIPLIYCSFYQYEVNFVSSE
jgi:hypothetical protein